MYEHTMNKGYNICFTHILFHSAFMETSAKAKINVSEVIFKYIILACIICNRYNVHVHKETLAR